MASSSPGVCVACGPCGGKGIRALKDGIWNNNPIWIQILGICSSLAVTNRLDKALVMGAAIVFVTAMSNLLISTARNATPRHVRMIAEMAIIATFVIVFDQFLKAFYWDMSRQLGPYVGLIITNCILMGRAEAFALQNSPLLSAVDGAANGLGYAAILAVMGCFRELVGTGQVLGHSVLHSSWYTPNQFMILAPGAFVLLGCMIAALNAIRPAKLEEKKA